MTFYRECRELLQRPGEVKQDIKALFNTAFSTQITMQRIIKLENIGTPLSKFSSYKHYDKYSLHAVKNKKTALEQKLLCHLLIWAEFKEGLMCFIKALFSSASLHDKLYIGTCFPGQPAAQTLQWSITQSTPAMQVTAGQHHVSVNAGELTDDAITSNICRNITLFAVCWIVN